MPPPDRKQVYNDSAMENGELEFGFTKRRKEIREFWITSLTLRMTRYNDEKTYSKEIYSVLEILSRGCAFNGLGPPATRVKHHRDPREFREYMKELKRAVLRRKPCSTKSRMILQGLSKSDQTSQKGSSSQR